MGAADGSSRGHSSLIIMRLSFLGCLLQTPAWVSPGGKALLHKEMVAAEPKPLAGQSQSRPSSAGTGEQRARNSY